MTMPERAELPTFTTMQQIIDYVRRSDEGEYDRIQRVHSEADALGFAVEQACYPRDSSGDIHWFYDHAEAFNQVLSVARIAKAEHPDLTLQMCQFEFWSSPWGFKTDDAVIYAMFWAATYLECDEFTVDDSDETVAQYVELIRWGREAGVTAELIGDYAESLFRGNHVVASKLGFGACFEPEKEYSDA
jgi:hypothetical protein